MKKQKLLPLLFLILGGIMITLLASTKKLVTKTLTSSIEKSDWRKNLNDKKSA